jgi:hypothetical protein
MKRKGKRNSANKDVSDYRLGFGPADSLLILRRHYGK